MSTNDNCPAIAERSTVKLAKKFRDLLLSEIGPADFMRMRFLNAEPMYDGSSSCASHDFCDANMVMLGAWEELGYGSMDASTEEDASLWNSAWAIAKRMYFTHYDPPTKE